MILFYVLMAYKWYHGMFLYQMQPVFFNTRFDGVTWLLMQTGLHEWLIGNEAGWIIFDVIFYSLPGLYWWVVYKKNWSPLGPGLIWLFVNWIYIQCYTLFPTNSIEAYLGWLLFPLLFSFRKLPTFFFVMGGLRYLFIFFLYSAGLWKLRLGGAFNPEQMSGVLLFQHKEYLVSAPQHWYSFFINWWVQHKVFGYVLYLALTAWELLVGIGFFTKKYDRIIFISVGVFLFFDVLIMRIPYFDIVPMAMLLLYSKYSLPEAEMEKSL